MDSKKEDKKVNSTQINDQKHNIENITTVDRKENNNDEEAVRWR